MQASSDKPDELFYSTSISLESAQIVLEGQEAIHCAKVLRKKVGDTIWVCDGKYHQYKTRIRHISKNEVFTEISDTLRFDANESDSYPILVIGKLKNKERLEWLIEKAVELGVAEIHLVSSERTERSYLKLERLEAIAVAAMKQSKRVFLPQIIDAHSIEETINAFGEAIPILIAHEKVSGRIDLGQIISKRCVLVVGPEGGFTDAEIEYLSSFPQSSTISLGEWRLRAETAAIHLLSLASFFRL
ncbi:16S rRNA (uracil(1498)-N(3))-methyltransferase [bacterium]|nr:MAG: 16S rRNA (uracil(1498)-N(3))-methyltransferase [bacterium]